MGRKPSKEPKVKLGVYISKEIADMLAEYAGREGYSVSAALEKRLKKSLKSVNKRYLMFKKSLNDVYPENVGIANDLKKQVEKMLKPDMGIPSAKIEKMVKDKKSNC